MKLLGWMHRKLRQNNSTEPFKDLVIGNSCNCLSGQPSVDDEQNYHQKPNLNIKFTKQTQKTQNNLRKSFASLQSTREEEDEDEYDDVESQASMFDLFPGFLAIGTLGSSDQTISSTPTLFPISVETITENEDQVVTENDLKLINDELEKVLTKDDLVVGSYDSSRRNSHVSTGRNSHVSIVTISGKPIENNEGYQYLTKVEGGKEFSNTESSICPLQGYLFGTAVEYSETAAVSVGKKEHHRTSLGELFQRSKLVGDDNFVAKDYDKRSERDHADKFSAMNLVKEKLKRRMFHSCSKNSASIDSASADTKLNKILHMFRKKVHPENSTIGQKSGRNRKNENKKKIMNDGGYNKGYIVNQEEDSASYREHWIKTDADYLVLEL